MLRLALMALFSVSIYSVLGQFHFDFNDNSFELDAHFGGQTEDFNLTDGSLHLNAAEAGTSFIHTRTNLPDSLETGLHVELDFAPSANNKLQIFLQIDTFDLDLASGYYLEIGENGNQDKIRFIRMIQGQSLVLAEGNPGEFGQDKLSFDLKVRKYKSGLWEILVRSANEDLFKLDIELFDSTIKRYYDQYFAIKCIYTSTRKDKFLFDDIFLKEMVPDTLPPDLLSHKTLDEFSLELEFNEVLDKQSLSKTDQYTWLGKDIHPTEVKFNEFRPNLLLLQFNASFGNREIHQLEIKGIGDLHGNTLGKPLVIPFYFPRKPLFPKDLVINEILFDPRGDGKDFLELYNPTEDILNLGGLKIRNATKTNEEVYVEEEYDLFPGEYLLLCEELEALKLYFLPTELNYLQNDLPAFNNDEGNASLLSLGLSIDSFDYHEDMHFQLIDDAEGISLERISPFMGSNDRANWHSASDLSGGATPGYENSQHRIINEDGQDWFYVEEKLFSPDNDGFQDQLIVHYKLPGEGFVGSIFVFDLTGNLVAQIINNKLLGTSGLLSWDGIDANIKVQSGPYLIYCSVFNEKGITRKQKLLVYLVDR